MSTVTAEQRRADGGPTPKKMGRPPKGGAKKIRVSTHLTPELLRKIEEDIERGNGASVSTLIFQIVKKYYS